MENYRSVAETAKRWGLSPRRVCTLCTEGRIPGAMHFVRVWAIPKDAEKPADARVKHGKYIGFSEKYRRASPRKKQPNHQAAASHSLPRVPDGRPSHDKEDTP
ncbi:MAG: hypothetical protein RR350_06555 [Oscillibacter sp.]